MVVVPFLVYFPRLHGQPGGGGGVARASGGAQQTEQIPDLVTRKMGINHRHKDLLDLGADLLLVAIDEGRHFLVDHFVDILVDSSASHDTANVRGHTAQALVNVNKWMGLGGFPFSSQFSLFRMAWLPWVRIAAKKSVSRQGQCTMQQTVR